MGLFSRLSLRAQLVLLLSAIAIVLAADRLRLIAVERAEEIARAERFVLDLARDGAERQAGIISEARVFFNMVTHMPVSRAAEAANCAASFRSMVAEVPWLNSLLITDTSGNVLCSNAGATVPGGLGDREYFRRALATGGFVVSDYLVGRISGRPAVVAGTPVEGADGVETLVFGQIDLDWLSRAAGEISAGPGGRVFVVDKDRTVIAGAPQAEAFIGQKLSETQVSPELFALSQGVATEPGDAAGALIVGIARLNGTGGSFVVTAPRSAVLANVNNRAKLALTKLFGTALVALLVVWLGGERLLIAPLSRLLSGVEKIGRGESSARVEAAGMAPEFQRLAHAFNDMADRLESRDRDLREANATLQQMATRDALTGLANRRLFDERVESEWRRASRDGSTISVVALDVDFFKRFNDTYGHPAGDACLRTVAEIVARHANRPADLAARTGGEEFVLLLPGATPKGAAEIAERIRAAIRREAVPHSGSSHGYVTASFGVASLKPSIGSDAQALLAQADRALYSAKHAGRNRVCRSDRQLRLAS